MTQTMLVNVLCFGGTVAVAVLQHYGLVDAQAALVLYGIAGGFLTGSGVTKVAPGQKVVQPKATETSPTKPSNGTNGVNG